MDTAMHIICVKFGLYTLYVNVRKSVHVTPAAIQQKYRKGAPTVATDFCTVCKIKKGANASFFVPKRWHGFLYFKGPGAFKFALKTSLIV